MSALVTLAPLGIVMVIYLTNAGQLVHGTPNPTWFERLGRRG